MTVNEIGSHGDPASSDVTTQAVSGGAVPVLEPEPRCALVVEDDRLTRTLLAELLGTHGFEVCTASSAPEARKALDEFDPDIALLDVDLGAGPSGIALAHLIRLEYPATAVLFVTRFPDEKMAQIFGGELPSGCGFMRKDRIDDVDYLLAAIESVLIQVPVDAHEALTPDHPLAGLTASQRDVLRMVAQGLTNTAIATRRGTSSSAVEQMLAHIFKILDVQTHGDLNPRVVAARIYMEAMGVPELP